MSGLIPSPKISLSTELLDNPFPTLFVAKKPANLPLVGKAQYIKEFSVALSKLEANTEDAFSRNHWGSIASGFSAAITIAGSGALIPVVGWILSGVSVVAAAASISGAIHTSLKVSPVVENLKRHRLALESQEAIQWAALWEFAGIDLFCRSLGYASRGFVSGGKLVAADTDSPFMRSVDFIAECTGLDYEQVIVGAGAIKNGFLPAQLPAPKVSNLSIEVQSVEEKLVEPEPYSNAWEPQEFVIPQNKQELIQALKQQCPALLKLVKSHPIRAVGVQRSGKTTLVKKLALLRMVLIPGHQVIASTLHYEKDNSYPNVFKVVGIKSGQRDYSAIRREWFQLAERVEACRINSHTTIWDEFGLMDKVLDESELTGVMTSCLRETMKFGEYPIFIVHGETQAFLPGTKGLVSVFLPSTVRVETIGEPVPDADGLETIRPTGKFTVDWLDGSRDKGQIPDWLTEEFLIELLLNSSGQQIQSVPTRKEDAQETPTEEVGQEIVNSLKISDDLAEPLKTIWLFGKEQGGWVKVRDIQRKDYAVLKGKNSDDIRRYLGLLNDMGYGKIEESGESVRFKAY